MRATKKRIAVLVGQGKWIRDILGEARRGGFLTREFCPESGYARNLLTTVPLGG